MACLFSESSQKVVIFGIGQDKSRIKIESVLGGSYESLAKVARRDVGRGFEGEGEMW